MHKDIMMQMSDGTERSVSFVANGATSLRYRMIFGRELGDDIARILTALQASEGVEVNADSDEVDVDQLKKMISLIDSGEMQAAYQLAYIMNATAEGKNMRTLDDDSYFDWLEQFEPMELLMHSTDVIGLYLNNRATSSTPKKKEDRLIGQ